MEEKLCVQWDLQSGKFGYHWVMKIDSSNFVIMA
jgi:hypothetical protein